MRSTLYLSVYGYGACAWFGCCVAVWRGGWCDAGWVVSVGIFFGDLGGCVRVAVEVVSSEVRWFVSIQPEQSISV